MDEFCQKELWENARRFQLSMERIFEKYSILQNQDDGQEVDLDTTQSKVLGRYMNQSKKKLDKLETQSLADVWDESLLAQDITRASQLNITHHGSGALDNPDSSCLPEDETMYNYDATHHTVSSCIESQTTFTETNNQEQENQDEQLEMSHQSERSSLKDLYPNVVSEIGKALHRQHVSEGADFVLRKYHKWRRQANRSNLTSSFNSTLRHTTDKKKSSGMLIKDTIRSPVESLAVPSTSTNSVSRSPVQNVTHVSARKTQQQFSPMTARGPQRREVHPPVVVIDFSVPQPNKTELNKTFIVSEELASPQRFHLTKRPSNYMVSPSRHSYPIALMSQDSFKIKESSPHHVQGASFSVPASKHTPLTERPSINANQSITVRLSPYAHLTNKERLGGSPRVCVASPNSLYVHRELKRPTSVSTSLSSPTPKIRVARRTLEYPDSRPSFEWQQSSPRSATAAGRQHGLRRHLSFDSFRSNQASYTAKDLDDDFEKLYHKFVCLKKSSSNGPSCLDCASRGQSFANLEALALSPHRSVLRKRHRECDRYSQSKRFRDSCSPYSPGSKRYRRDLMGVAVSPHQLEPDKKKWFSLYCNNGPVTKFSPHM